MGQFGAKNAIFGSFLPILSHLSAKITNNWPYSHPTNSEHVLQMQFNIWLPPKHDFWSNLAHQKPILGGIFDIFVHFGPKIGPQTLQVEHFASSTCPCMPARHYELIFDPFDAQKGAKYNFFSHIVS